MLLVLVIIYYAALRSMVDQVLVCFVERYK